MGSGGGGGGEVLVTLVAVGGSDEDLVELAVEEVEGDGFWDAAVEGTGGGVDGGGADAVDVLVEPAGGVLLLPLSELGDGLQAGQGARHVVVRDDHGVLAVPLLGGEDVVQALPGVAELDDEPPLLDGSSKHLPDAEAVLGDEAVEDRLLPGAKVPVLRPLVPPSLPTVRATRLGRTGVFQTLLPLELHPLVLRPLLLRLHLPVIVHPPDARRHRRVPHDVRDLQGTLDQGTVVQDHGTLVLPGEGGGGGGTGGENGAD